MLVSTLGSSPPQAEEGVETLLTAHMNQELLIPMESNLEDSPVSPRRVWDLSSSGSSESSDDTQSSEEQSSSSVEDLSVKQGLPPLRLSTA